MTVDIIIMSGGLIGLSALLVACDVFLKMRNNRRRKCLCQQPGRSLTRVMGFHIAMGDGTLTGICLLCERKLRVNSKGFEVTIIDSTISPLE